MNAVIIDISCDNDKTHMQISFIHDNRVNLCSSIRFRIWCTIVPKNGGVYSTVEGCAAKRRKCTDPYENKLMYLNIHDAKSPSYSSCRRADLLATDSSSASVSHSGDVKAVTYDERVPLS